MTYLMIPHNSKDFFMKLPIEQTCTLSIEQQLDNISMESDFVNNLIGRLDMILPNLLGKLIDISNTFTIDIDARLSKDLKKQKILVSKAIKHKTLENIGGRLVRVPLHLDTKILTYLNMLDEVNEDSYAKGVEALGNYSFILSKLLTNLDDKKALTDHTAYYKELEKTRIKFVEILEDYTDTSKSNDKYPLENVVDRLADMPEIMDKALHLSRHINDNTMTEVKSATDKVIDLLKILQERINDKSLDTISGNVVKNIAEGAYITANFVEHVSIVRYKVIDSLESAVSVSEAVVK